MFHRFVAWAAVIYVNSINRLFFVIVVHCDFFDVGIEFLNDT
jgi:hypothetical protein